MVWGEGEVEVEVEVEVVEEAMAVELEEVSSLDEEERVRSDACLLEGCWANVAGAEWTSRWLQWMGSLRAGVVG